MQLSFGFWLFCWLYVPLSIRLFVIRQDSLGPILILPFWYENLALHKWIVFIFIWLYQIVPISFLYLLFLKIQ